jgi:predicted transposase YdaD
MNEAFKIKWEEGKAEGIEEGIKEGQKTGEMNMLIKMLRHGRITVDEAAAEAGMSVEKFNKCAESLPSQSKA